MKLKIVIIFMAVVAFSCGKKSSQEGQSSLKKPEKIKMEIDILKDSMDKAWNLMMESDDQKFKDIKRLLDEVSYTDRYNLVMHDSISKFRERVLQLRYDSISLSDSKRIDQYDFATDSLLKGTFKLVESTPDIDHHPIAKTLTDDIMDADNKLVRYRANYDKWAIEYNSYIEKHENKLKKLGSPYDSYAKRPLFAISN